MRWKTARTRTTPLRFRSHRHHFVAKETGRPKSFFLRSLLGENIERLEWEADLEQKAAEIRAGRRRTYSLDEVETGLAD